MKKSEFKSLMIMSLGAWLLLMSQTLIAQDTTKADVSQHKMEMQKPRYTTSSPMIDATKKIIEAYENQDWETWKMQYADTAKVFHNNWDQAATPEDFIANQREFLDDFTSYSFVDDPVFYEQIIDDKGQKWVYFWGIWEGTLAANNQKLRIPVHLALLYKDGKIMEEYGFYDMSPYMKAMQKQKN